LCDILGYRAEQLVGQPVRTILRKGPPNPEYQEFLSHVRITRTNHEIDLPGRRLIHTDGRWLDVNLHVCFGQESQAFYVQAEPLGRLQSDAEIFNVDPSTRYLQVVSPSAINGWNFSADRIEVLSRALIDQLRTRPDHDTS
jgi:hypothetical protein